MKNNNLINSKNYGYRTFNVKKVIKDNESGVEEIITPNILESGDTLVLCGSENVGKSDFLLHWMMDMAAGNSFIGMKPHSPLKILFIRKEASYKNLQNSINVIDSNHNISLAKFNIAFFAASKIRLNKKQDQEAILQAVKRHFREAVDIIVIDNIINENPRVNIKDDKIISSPIEYDLEALRESINPQAAIILTYNYDRKNKIAPVEKPFCFYKTIIMHNRSLNYYDATLEFDFSDKKKRPSIDIDKTGNHWHEVIKGGEHVKLI
jgi:hypothetical protein